MSIDADLPSEFYELVGRVALEAALLEERLAEIATYMSMRDLSPADDFAGRLSGAMQRFGGMPGTALTKSLRSFAIESFPTGSDQEFQAFLDSVDSALRNRHEVIHSLWIEATDGRVGWRSLPAARRPAPEQIVHYVQLSKSALEQELRLLESLVVQLEDWRKRIPNKN